MGPENDEARSVTGFANNYLPLFSHPIVQREAAGVDDDGEKRQPEPELDAPVVFILHAAPGTPHALTIEGFVDL